MIFTMLILGTACTGVQTIPDTPKALADYEEQQKQGVTEYTFNPVKLGIKGATYWEEKYKRKTGKSPEAEAADTKPVEQPSA